MRNFSKLLFVFVCFVLVASCGDDASPPAQQQPGEAAVDFSGRFEGTEQGSENNVPFQTTITVIVTQSGNTVTGNYSNGLGGAGTVNCTLSGNTLNCTLDQASACPSFSTATLNGNHLTGNTTRNQSLGCAPLSVTFEMFRVTAPPPPTPTPTPTPTFVAPDWDLALVNLVNGQETRYSFDDNGNYSGTPHGRTGKMSSADLGLLDSLIDAIKEEAHDPFVCRNAIILVDRKVVLAFANLPNAIVYETDGERNRECWSGEESAVRRLVSELDRLGKKYVFPDGFPTPTLPAAGGLLLFHLSQDADSHNE